MVSEVVSARGRYDRRATPAERARRQRDRILRATAKLVLERGAESLTVDRVIRSARVGRNTFYSQFEDVSDLLDQLSHFAVRSFVEPVERRLTEPATPTEQLRRIVETWVEQIADEPELARATLGRTGPEPSHAVVSRLRKVLERVLRDAHRDAVVSHPPDGFRLAAAVAVLISTGVQAAQSSSTRRRAPEVGVDLVLRLVR